MELEQRVLQHDETLRFHSEEISNIKSEMKTMLLQCGLLEKVNIRELEVMIESAVAEINKNVKEVIE